MPVEIFSGEHELPRLVHVTYVFPGQGSQAVGMVRDVYDGILASRKIVDTAKDILGENIVNLIFDDPKGELNKTENAQPLILVASIASLVGYLDHNVYLQQKLPALIFGHSLGELTALVVGGVLSFEDAVKIAKIRGEIMAGAPPGKMVAVKNIPEEKLNCLLNTFPIDIGLVNTNKQIVLSGEEKAMDEAFAYLKTQNIKALPLRISVASHSRVMRTAQLQFSSALEAFEFHDSLIPIISVFGAQKLENGALIKNAFIEQMTHALDFPRMLSAAKQLGIDIFIEFGPKGASKDGIICANIHELDPSLTAINIRDLLTIRDNSYLFHWG